MNAKERRRLRRLEEQQKDSAIVNDTKVDAQPEIDAVVKTKEFVKCPVKTQNKSRKRKELEPGKIHRTLFIGQLPFSTTKEDLQEHFRDAGDFDIRMLSEKATGKFRGIAYIEVKNDESIKTALSKHHTLLKGRRINVEFTTSGGGTKSKLRTERLSAMKGRQTKAQVDMCSEIVNRFVKDKEKNVVATDVDDRVVDFLSWFDMKTAAAALDEFSFCVSDRVSNRTAFLMGILKRYRKTDGVEREKRSQKA